MTSVGSFSRSVVFMDLTHFYFCFYTRSSSDNFRFAYHWDSIYFCGSQGFRMRVKDFTLNPSAQLSNFLLK